MRDAERLCSHLRETYFLQAKIVVSSAGERYFFAGLLFCSPILLANMCVCGRVDGCILLGLLVFARRYLETGTFSSLLFDSEGFQINGGRKNTSRPVTVEYCETRRRPTLFGNMYNLLANMCFVGGWAFFLGGLLIVLASTWVSEHLLRCCSIELF